MQVKNVYHWYGCGVPEKFQGEGPFEVSSEDLVQLVTEFDVAFMHVAAEDTLSRKARKKSTEPRPDNIILALDVKGGHFRQR